MTDKNAVVLLSGGLDSATAAIIAKSEGYNLYGLTIAYGQRHLREVESAKLLAKTLGMCQHRIVDISLREIGGSALTDDILVPVNRSDAEISTGIPVTYVPARNTIFLSVALGYAEVVKANVIVAGMNQVDYSGYPDCRSEYLESFQRMADLATKAGVEDGIKYQIYTPLINMTKSEIISAGLKLSLDYSLTWSCYNGGEYACGICDSCKIRLAGFSDAGEKDPIKYEIS
jgi:7-cyano-7-deazaguanine synthase